MIIQLTSEATDGQKEELKKIKQKNSQLFTLTPQLLAGSSIISLISKAIASRFSIQS